MKLITAVDYHRAVTVLKENFKHERVLAIPSMIKILIKIYVLHLLHMRSGELISFR